MLTVIRYHLDENMPNAVAAGLRKRGRDVTSSNEVGLLGASDEKQLAFSHANGRVIVTRDDDLLTLNSEGAPHSGIVYWLEKHSLGQLIKDLDQLCFEMTASDIVGRIIFL